ncbi:MAG: sugar ABC transporter permease [Oscillospiraceae bacterium]|nr:sugar ABC transporter permease [Oscillospiraceae bacterium]MCI9392524.1 sugar ABC transporter permease [Oscillospiraceae bacterium]
MEDILSAKSGIGGFFSNFGTALARGDWSVKLSLLWWGAGYARRRQFAKALLMTLVEAGVAAFTLLFAMQYVPKFGTLGTVQAEQVFNIATMKAEWNDYDNSFLILLFSLFSFVVWFAAAAVWMRNVVNVYRLQLQAEAGRHVNTFAEDLRSYLDEKFHITLLALPALGVAVFTVIPILLLILVAFTNYDQQHMPPTNLFSWVGINNFVTLFSGGSSVTLGFGYAFVRVLGWTLVWSLFATFTTYIGGILMSLLLNNKMVRWPKLWRTMFMVTIAVPQFVSLLLMRNFFSNGGIANTICANIGLTGFLRDIGAISTAYIPFLSAPGWAHVMIILINIWIGVPYQMLIATGVLMNLPGDQLESARIDGANPYQTFRHITMPYMLFVTGPALVTDFVKNMNNFNVIYLLTQDVYTTTNQVMANAQAREVDLLVTWLFTLTQDYYNYKMASVIGIMVFVVCAVITLVAFNFMIRGDKEEGYQ